MQKFYNSYQVFGQNLYTEDLITNTQYFWVLGLFLYQLTMQNYEVIGKDKR